MTQDRARVIALVALLASLGTLAALLAVSRIYQVDEAQNLFMARVLAEGQAGRFFTTAELWFLGPLSWIARGAASSTEMFRWARLLFLVLFFSNVVLLAAATGARLATTRGLVTIVGAATLAPLWDYGFEVRHDNLILGGLLFTWVTGRVRPQGARSYFLMGIVAALLPFVALKATAYVLPLSAVFLAWPPPGHSRSRARLAFSWVLGAAGAFLVVTIAYWTMGLWPVFLAGFHGGLRYSAGPGRFAPWGTLARTLTQTPLLVGVVAAGMGRWAFQLLRRDRRAMGWGGLGPEVILLLGSVGLLGANPAPYPYNLANVVPFAFLFAMRVLEGLRPSLERPALRGVAAGLVLFAHMVPFGVATLRHFERTNERQEWLMEHAEALTDPAQDRVYDAIGMVPTRSSIHFDWFLHSLTIRSFVDGTGPSVREMLAANPAAVLIPSYRTDWLRQADHDFIRAHYVALADDFLVLGSRLQSGGGLFEVLHPGRYQIVSEAREALSGVTIDGRAVDEAPLALTAGSHRLSGTDDIAVVWVGPRLEHVPFLGQGDHSRLFVNWY